MGTLVLCHLDSHVDDFKANGNYGGIELMAMGTSQFSATQNMFSQDFVAAMYARILSNSMTLMTPTFDPLGIVIDGLLCHLNHSCSPNTYIVMDGPQMQLRALNDIKKGEELYISYIDPMMPFIKRQTQLQSRWFFTCKCSKCSLGDCDFRTGKRRLRRHLQSSCRGDERRGTGNTSVPRREPGRFHLVASDAALDRGRDVAAS